MTTVSVFAPAKINLALHVTGRRADGYHLLDSLVVFAPVGDTLVFRPGEGLSLTVDGPEASGVPADMNNLAMKALAGVSKGRGAALTLTKELPAASGIGGGSADAAAAVRGALAFWDDEVVADPMALGQELMSETRSGALATLGADIPMCLLSRPCRARGVGDRLDMLALPPVPAVLANPRLPVSTPSVFSALSVRENAPMPEDLPDFGGAADLISWLGGTRNDLEDAARRVAPVIGEVLSALGGLDGARLVRMSGSGATCFALFEDEKAAESAAATLASEKPAWWIESGVLGDQFDLAVPRTT